MGEIIMTSGEQEGFDLCKSYEKFVGHPYYATKAEEKKGTATIGYGMCFYPDDTRVTIDDEPITEEAALLLFTQIWNKRKAYVESKCKGIATTDKQLGAMTCFLYWSGYGNFSKSQLLAYHLRGDHEQAAREFMSKSWTTQGGLELGGLVSRRKKEQLLYRG